MDNEIDYTEKANVVYESLPEGFYAVEVPVKFHGREEEYREYVAPGRRVVKINGAREWPYDSPEVCEYQGGDGIWHLDGKFLLCPGCGLDCT